MSRKRLPVEIKTCAWCGAGFTRREKTERTDRFRVRRFCSTPCSRRGRVKRAPGQVGNMNGNLTIPREPIARILRRELTRYSPPDLYSPPEERESRGIGLMSEDIARTQGLKPQSVVRRISRIIGDPTRRGVMTSTVDWLLDGLAIPDVWHVELHDWHRILIAYEAGQLTLGEYRDQSALYNLIAQAETAAVSTGSKATVSDQRRVAA